MHPDGPRAQSNPVRRSLLLTIPVVTALISATAAVVISSTGSPDSDPKIPTVIASPDDPSKNRPVAYVDLDLPELEVNPEWYEGNYAPGSVGVIWLTREGTDPSELLKKDIQREVYEELRNCFPEDATNEQLYQGKVECFDEKVIKRAAAEENPIDVFVAVAALNRARPDVFTVCHNAAHKVGEIALRRVVPVHGMQAEIIAAMLDSAGGSCMGGLMHGLLDAVGLLVDDVDDFRAAVAGCLQANPDNLGYCTDAVGHATWDTFERLDRAVEVCAFFPQNYSRRECGEGIMMRMYQRAEVEDTWYVGNVRDDEVDTWNDAVFQICQEWPTERFAAAPTDDPREWCWSGAVYLLFKPIFSALEAAGGDYTKSKAKIIERMSKAVQTCQRFPEEGVDLCLARMGPSVGHAAVFEKENVPELCDVFPDEPTRARCVDEANRRIDAAYED